MRFLRRLSPEPSPPIAYLVGLVGVASAGLVIGRIADLFQTDNRRLSLYLLPILFVGGRWGVIPAVVAAVGASLFHYVVHLAPFDRHLGVEDVFELSLLLVVGTVAGSLAAEARASARLARDSEIRATLLASVSHDLRTPLTAIKTSVAALRDPTVVLPDTTRQELLASVETEADRLVHFVTNVLLLTRLESGVQPARDWNAIGELLFAAVDRCASVLGDRPVTVDAPDSLPLVRVDAALIDQAVTNLVENAAIHTPPGTPVRVRAAVEGHDLRLEVEDDGPGVPVADRERVLLPFHRGNGRTTPGVGLGLAIARAAAEAHDGAITIGASANGGARVVLHLPDAARGTR
jgi:two-component system sensor histidine kinase KdpD